MPDKSHGFQVRAHRVFPGGRAALVAVLDDGFFSGPKGRLLDPAAYVEELVAMGVTGVMGFPGILERFVSPKAEVARIMNLSSAGFGEWSSERRVAVPLRAAVRAAADAIVIHVSLGVPGEAKMLADLARTAANAHDFGLPVVAAIYYRRARDHLRDQATAVEETMHAARIALELDADIVKVAYTGDPKTFASVVGACSPLSVLVAGGEYISDSHLLALAHGSIEGGAAGLCFGRGLAQAADLAGVLRALGAVSHEAPR